MIRVAWRHGGAELGPRRVVVAHRNFAFGWLPPRHFLGLIPLGRVLPFGVDPTGDAVAWSPYPVPMVELVNGAVRAFPVITSRPRYAGKSFSSERRGKLHRHHAAVDLHGEIGESVVAPVDGVITGIQPYYKTKSGHQTDAILIFDGATTYLLGEITPGSPAAAGVDVGDPVHAGQLVGTIGATGHLHFGTYAGRHKAMTASERWLWGQPPPPHLRNPVAFLKASIPIWEPVIDPPPASPVADDHDHDHGHDDAPEPAPPEPAPWTPAPAPPEPAPWTPAPAPPEPAPYEPGGVPWTPLDPLYTPDEPGIPWTPAPENWHPQAAPRASGGGGGFGLAVLALLALAALASGGRRG